MSRWLAGIVLLGIGLATSSSDGAIVDFVGGTWDHGSGNVSGWQAPPNLANFPYSGTTTVAGVDVTLTFSNVGTNTSTNPLSADQLQTTTLAGGSGLNLNQSAGAAYNAANSPLANYLRIDVSFSAPVEVSMFFHDVDQGNDVTGSTWRDALYSESFIDVFGTLGTGTRADDTLGTNVTTRLLHDQDLTAIVPRTSAPNEDLSLVTSPTELTSATAEIFYSSPVQYFSIYLWNRNSSSQLVDNQRVILTAFDITPAEIPEPSSWFLLSSVAAVSLARRVRRSKRAV